MRVTASKAAQTSFFPNNLLQLFLSSPMPAQRCNPSIMSWDCPAVSPQPVTPGAYGGIPSFLFFPSDQNTSTCYSGRAAAPFIPFRSTVFTLSCRLGQHVKEPHLSLLYPTMTTDEGWIEDRLRKFRALAQPSSPARFHVTSAFLHPVPPMLCLLCSNLCVKSQLTWILGAVAYYMNRTRHIVPEEDNGRP